MRYIFYMLFLAWPLSGMALDRYVATNGSHTAPFTSWANAATNLKVAVDWANTNNAMDTVWVSNGVYVLSVQVDVTNTVVRGISTNPADVIIDGGNYEGRATTNRCFRLNHANALLTCLAITNGEANAATLPIYYGGGVYIDDAGGTVSNCTIILNKGVDGAGISTRDNDGKIYNCLITSNRAVGRGAVGFWFGGFMRDCTVAANAATGSAGGVVMNNNGIIENCRIIDNGSYSSDSSSYGGGGIYLGANATMRNCLVYGNWANSRGAVYARESSLIQNCTIVSNRAGGGNTGGIYFYGATCRVDNTIIHFNSNPQWDKYSSTTYLSFTNCCTSTDPTTNGTGNIVANPQFVAASQFDYHLQSTSLCVNAGVNRDWMGGSTDLDRHARIDRYFGIVDIGCFEYLWSGTMFLGY